MSKDAQHQPQDDEFARAAEEVDKAAESADVEGHSVDEAEGEQNWTIGNYSCA